MSAEDKLLEAIDEEDNDEIEMPAMYSRLTRRHERLQHKNKINIDDFLGDGHRVNAVIMLPRYYGELLTWALHRYIEQEEWKIVRTLGYRSREPVYRCQY